MAVAVERGAVQFGPFRVDTKTQRLYRDQIWIKLPRQSFLILQMLLAQPGEVVSREELRAALWPSDTFVDFDHGLNNAVNRLRLALNDRTESPTYVETLPTVGYRFVGSVQVVDNGTTSEAASTTESASATVRVEPRPSVLTPQPWWKSRGLLVWPVILASAILGTWWFKLGFRGEHSEIHSIAVLPLQNLSGDPGQEYFADGTTEELITTLAKLTDLRVISRTSAMRMKGVQKSIRDVGSDLGVDAVVEGSIARSPETVRITVQLIDVRADRHLWAEEYQDSPGEILRLQQKVALAIASQVSEKIIPQQEAHFRSAKLVKQQAHDLYLKAQSYSAQGTPESLTKSIELYQQAIALQPDYAAAYSGMAASYCTIASGWDDPHVFFPRAREAALKALSLDSSIPGALVALAWIKHAYDWDTAGAEAEFQKALKLNGYDAQTHSRYASFLADVGRYDEGLAEARLAEDLDPLALHASFAAERVLMRGRRFEEFLKQAVQSRKLDPNSVPTTYHSVIVYENLGRFEDAIHEIEGHDNWEDPPGLAIENAKQLRAGLRAEGPKGYWREALRECLKPPADDHWHTAHAYFMLGNNEAGLRELELTVQQHDSAIRFDIMNSPWWDPVRNDPRFQELLKKAGY